MNRPLSRRQLLLASTTLLTGCASRLVSDGGTAVPTQPLGGVAGPLQPLGHIATLLPAATPAPATVVPPSPTLTPSGIAMPADAPTATPSATPATQSPAANETPWPSATASAAATPAPAATETPPVPPQPTPSAIAAGDDVAARVAALLAALSLEQKVGQLFLVHFQGATVSPFLEQLIADCHVGGIVLFAIAGNIVNTTQVAQLTEAVQTAAASAGSVPLLIAMDQEGGLVVRIREGATVFPSNMAVGASGSADMAAAMAATTATELTALGVNMNLAPVVDVNSNPDNPVIGTRSFGSSPEAVATLGAAMVVAGQEASVAATAKHFPGHGDTDIDSHVGLPVITHDRAHLDNVELPPFRAAIAAGVDAIMTAHLEVPAIDPTPGLPATLSAKVLQGLLRQELGFPGVIVSDSLGMGALTSSRTVPEIAVQAIEAGCDILAFGADAGQGQEVQLDAYKAVLALFTSGALPEGRLDESVRRILLLKARRGVLDRQRLDTARLADSVGTAEHLAIARGIAEAALTLVRNDQALLPLPPETPTLVVAPDGVGDLASAMKAYFADVATATVSLDPTADEVAAAVQQAQAYSAIVVATADTGRHLAQVDLVQQLVGPGLAVVSLRTPYDLVNFPGAPCYVAAYCDVPVSLDAVARLLCGQLAPQGHLPVDIPGLYALGHGMTSFTG